jgi:hypothetical protein
MEAGMGTFATGGSTRAACSAATSTRSFRAIRKPRNIGLAGVLGGVTVLGADASQSQENSVPPTGLVIIGAGLFVELIGSILELNAVPHLFDAVNSYNDGLLAGSPPGPPAP